MVAAAVVALALFPGVASAQETQRSIAGVVRDASGAVLPGVTVEAASPALIEKLRSVVTDGTGQYRIVNLPPGLYTVTFTLPGFNTVKTRRHRARAASSPRSTPTSGRRARGTITVTGETPIVDVQSAKRAATLDNEMLDVVADGASARDAILTLIPSMVTSGGGKTSCSSARDDRLRRPRRPRQRRPRPGRRPNTGASLNGGGVSGYRRTSRTRRR